MPMSRELRVYGGRTKETMMAKHYTFFSITHTTDAWVPAYAAAVPDLVVKHGAVQHS